MPTCIKCGETKDEVRFYRRPGTGKLRGECMSCSNLARRKDNRPRASREHLAVLKLYREIGMLDAYLMSHFRTEFDGNDG